MLEKLIDEIEKILEVGAYKPKQDIFAPDFEYVEKEKKTCSICINGFIWYNMDEISFDCHSKDLIINNNGIWCGNINHIREKEIEITDIFNNNIHITIK